MTVGYVVMISSWIFKVLNKTEHSVLTQTEDVVIVPVSADILVSGLH